MPHRAASEDARVSALHRYRILDTFAEPPFERLTTLAGRLFQAPVVAISLVDENRIWFKSRVGLPVSEVPRQGSFFDETIQADDVVVIPDLTQDLRFSQFSLVQGSPNVRFYAGAPLRTLDGYNLGVFAVMDVVARRFSRSQRQTLADLADLAINQMELRLAGSVMRQRDLPDGPKPTSRFTLAAIRKAGMPGYQSDRRNQNRHGSDRLIWLTVFLEQAERLQVRVLDFSATGLGLFSDEELPVGAPIMVEIGTSYILGEICYSRLSDKGYRSGVRLEHAIPSVKELVPAVVAAGERGDWPIGAEATSGAN